MTSPWSSNSISYLLLGDPNGSHIVLDSDQSVISVFDANHVEIGRIAPDGVWYKSPDGSYVRLFDEPVTGSAVASFRARSIPGYTTKPASIGADTNGGVGTQVTYLEIQGPAPQDPPLNGYPSILLSTHEVGAPFFRRMTLSADRIIIDGEVNLGTPPVNAKPVSVDGGPFATLTGGVAYQVSTSSLGAVFVAPPTGAVEIRLEGLVGSDSTVMGRQTYLSADVREGNVIGAGTIVLPAADNRAAVFFQTATAVGNKMAWVSITMYVVGLVAGDTYNVQRMARVDNAADTGSLQRNRILVNPMLVTP